MPISSATILAVTGLEREARIIAGPKFITVIGGGDRNALQTRIRAALETGAHRILSIGICGGLSPSLRVGDCIVATEIVSGDRRFATDDAWTRDLLARLPGAHQGILAGSDSIVDDRTEKERLHRTTGAIAVDMESHVAAMIAQEQGLRFAAMRIVSDSLSQSLPPAALAAMSSGGGVQIRAVLRSLFARPEQIPALIRTAWEAEKAFRALGRCRQLLAAPAAADRP